MTEMKRFIEAMPKAELHVHVEAFENFMADWADAIQRHIVESVSLAGQRRLVRSRQGCRRTRGSRRETSRREGLARTPLHPSNGDYVGKCRSPP